MCDMSVPNFGRRLMPSVLQEEAVNNPKRLYAKIPASNGEFPRFRSVPFDEINHAVDSIAHFLVATLGYPRQTGETLAFLGIPDIRYNIVFYACIKCGFKVFLPSPRNPANTNISLMRQTGCLVILHTAEVTSTIEGLQALQPDLRCLRIGAVDELLQSRSAPFPYELTFANAKDEPILVLHSSGSTGMPKPVVMSHATFATVDNDRNFPSIPGRRNHDLTVWDFDGAEALIYEPFPPFHLAGFMNKIMVPLWTKTAPVFGPASRPPSGALAASIMRSEKIRGAVLPPVIAEQLYREDGGAELLKSLDVLCFAGGPLAQAVGDELVKHTLLCQFYGSTEAGQIRQLVPHREDWSYMEFHPKLKFTMQPVDDAYELVLLADDSTAEFSALHYNFPEAVTWHTKDLFKPHPTKPNLWRFYARRDDVIVLSSGEKLNPVPFEGHVSATIGISGAMVVGHGRVHPVLLVELEDSNGPSKQNLETLRRSVSEANRLVPTYGRIGPSSIIFSNPDKPFPRAGKGTVIRSQTVSLYENEIESFFQSPNPATAITAPRLEATSYTASSVRALVGSIIKQATARFDIKDSDDLYLSGLDSLGTMEITKLLRQSVQDQKPCHDLSWISIELFYNNPTIEEISQIILDFLNHSKPPRTRNRAAEMQFAIDSYTQQFPTATSATKEEIASSGICIAITGSTGYVGSRLLLSLLARPDVSCIYCLNRSNRGEEVWLESLRSGHPEKPSKKPVFLQVDFSSRTLGLSSENLHDFISKCDLIIHNAWAVNFNLSLRSFHDNLRSVRSLINLSLKSTRRPRIAFISSIAATGVWSKSFDESLTIPEANVFNLEQALATGYGESKMVAEQILHIASQRTDVPVTIMRVGQVAPPSDHGESQWPERDAVPTLLRASKLIGMVPSDLSDIDWVPVDQLASIIGEVTIGNLQADKPLNCAYYNVTNPQRTPWIEVVPVIQRWCGEAATLTSFTDWIQHLRLLQSSAVPDAQAANNLLYFFGLLETRGKWAEWDTQNSRNASQTFRNLVSINTVVMQQWLQGLSK